MKLKTFLGAENEDYDVWWEDLQEFFQLYTFSEEEKKIIKCTFGWRSKKIYSE